MNYYITTINEGSEVVVIYARNKFVARALINDDCEKLEKISVVEAKNLISRGFRVIR